MVEVLQCKICKIFIQIPDHQQQLDGFLRNFIPTHHLFPLPQPLRFLLLLVTGGIGVQVRTDLNL